MRSRLGTLIVVAIVAGTFVIGLIVGAQRDDETGPVDLVVLNGRVYTADGSATVAEALAVRGNTILRVGSNREIKRLAGRATQTIDAHGASVLPGFDDAHLHLVSGGLGLQQANLLDASTLDEIAATIKAFAAAHPDRPWVLGRGWYYTPFPGGLPTRQQLDAIVPDRPACMRCYDGHTTWVNTLALKAAGITKATPDPPGGVIVRDPATGEPTGVLKEGAQPLVSKDPPAADAGRAAAGDSRRDRQGTPVRRDERAGRRHRHGRARAVRRAGSQGRAAGSVSTTRCSIDPPLHRGRRRPVRRLLEEAAPNDALIKTGAVKLMLDGVIESHTALMLAPYTNRPTTGLPEHGRPDAERDRRDDGPPRLADADPRHRRRRRPPVARRLRAGRGGEPGPGARPAPSTGARRDAATPPTFPRFGRLDVLAVQQPFHGNPNPTQLEVWRTNIGPERASRGWAQRSILDAGGRMAMGTDWPVVTLDPRFQINMAINRTTPEGTPPDGWLPEQRLTLAAAIDAYTTGAAYASFDEQRKGQLVPGMLADIVILSTDVFAMPPGTSSTPASKRRSSTARWSTGRRSHERDAPETTDAAGRLLGGVGLAPRRRQPVQRIGARHHVHGGRAGTGTRHAGRRGIRTRDEASRRVRARRDPRPRRRRARSAGARRLAGRSRARWARRSVMRWPRPTAACRRSRRRRKRPGASPARRCPSTSRAHGKGRIAFTRRVPIGPVAAISPFNFPFNLAAHKLAPAVAAGNPIVLKPASKTPLSALVLADALDRAGLPKGALSVLPMSRNDRRPNGDRRPLPAAHLHRVVGGRLGDEGAGRPEAGAARARRQRGRRSWTRQRTSTRRRLASRPAGSRWPARAASRCSECSCTRRRVRPVRRAAGRDASRR